MRARARVARQLLSLSGAEGDIARRLGFARFDPAPGVAAPRRGLSAHRPKAPARRPRRQRQAGFAADAGRQPVGLAPAPVPVTTQGRHGFAIVANLTRGLRPTAPDQIWVADITYVRLAEAFVYLAVIVDAFSRRVVGFALDDHLKTELALAALERAFAARSPPPGLIHHSDRGVQYACDEYVARLEARGLQLSMSRPANPYDNAKAESFMKTLKAEEANGQTYRDLDDARARIGAFIEEIYNVDRLHSALGYLSPVEFEHAFHQHRTPTPNPKPALSPK